MQPDQCLQQHIVCVGLLQDTAPCNRLFVSLWLAKAYLIPADLYGSQVLAQR